MTNRKTKDILLYITKEWELSLNETDILEQILEVFKERDLNILKRIESVIEEDYRSLLKMIPDNLLFNFAVDNFDLVDASDSDDLIDALKELNYDFLNEIDDDDLLERVSDLGYTLIEEETNITLDSQREELLEAFDRLDFAKREQLIKQIWNTQ